MDAGCLSFTHNYKTRRCILFTVNRYTMQMGMIEDAASTWSYSEYYEPGNALVTVDVVSTSQETDMVFVVFCRDPIPASFSLILQDPFIVNWMLCLLQCQ